MSIYKTEIMGTGLKIFSEKATTKDVEQFTEFFNSKCADGWNLLSYSYAPNTFNIKHVILATFVKGDSSYEYKTELIGGKRKAITSNTTQSDADSMNNALEEFSADGWELVTYCLMSNLDATSVLTFTSKGVLLATFRRKMQ